MTDRTETEKKLTALVYNLREELENLIGTCKTTKDLAAVLGIASQTNTYLARGVAVAVSSFVHGGVQPRPGEAYSVTTQAASDLVRINSLDGYTGQNLAGHIRQMISLQSASSFATAEAHSAVAEAGDGSLEELLVAATESAAEGDVS